MKLRPDISPDQINPVDPPTLDWFLCPESQLKPGEAALQIGACKGEQKYVMRRMRRSKFWECFSKDDAKWHATSTDDKKARDKCLRHMMGQTPANDEGETK